MKTLCPTGRPAQDGQTLPYPTCDTPELNLRRIEVALKRLETGQMPDFTELMTILACVSEFYTTLNGEDAHICLDCRPVYPV